jgi:hypothetical protein
MGLLPGRIRLNTSAKAAWITPKIESCGKIGAIGNLNDPVAMTLPIGAVSFLLL